jgi:exonuclease SbcC
MRILRISLRNIASLAGDHRIDFTREPLRSAGLFSISGPTGSGKSTLLDALCLALYEKTPRLKAVSSGAVKLADGAGEITQSDPRNLLSRGTAEGSAEVAFIGVDGLPYTARWSVRRARNKPDGGLRGTDIVLLRGDVPPGAEGVIEQGGKKSEVLPAIEAKIGLSFEQFTRAVLLAQNEFATFLKADDKERAEILQALTGTERFEQISIAVFTRNAAERKAVEEIQSRLAGSAPMSAEDRAQAEAAAAASEAAWTLAGEKVATRKLHMQWFLRLRELAAQAAAAEAQLQAARTAREAAQPRRLELAHTELASTEARSLRDAEQRALGETATAAKRCADSDTAQTAALNALAEQKRLLESARTEWKAAHTAFDTARPLLLQARELEARLAPLAQQLARATDERTKAEDGVRAAAERHDALQRQRLVAEDELKIVRARRVALAAVAPFAADAQVWPERLVRAEVARKAMDESARGLDRATKEEKARTDAAGLERAKADGVRTAASAAAVRLEAAEVELRKFDAEKTANERRSADEARAALGALAENLRTVVSLGQQVETLQREADALRMQDEADTRTLARLKESQLPAAANELQTARQSYGIAEAAVTDAALQLREKLADHQPCPVCGSTDHPFAAHPPSHETAALRALGENLKAREKALEDLRTQAVRLETATAARRTQATEKSGVLAKLAAELAGARQFRPTHSSALAIADLPEAGRSAALAAQLAAEEQRLKLAEESSHARTQAEKQREACRAEHDRAAREVAALDAALAKLAEEIARAQTSREAAAAAHAQAEAAFRTAMEAIAPIFNALSDAREKWAGDAAAFREGFATEIATVLQLDKEAAALDASLREKGAALAPLKEACEKADKEGKARREAEAAARTEHDTVQKQRAALFNGRPADAVEAEIQDALRRAGDTQEQRAATFNEGEKHVATAAENFRTAHLALHENRLQSTAATAQLEAWLATFAARTTRALERPALDLLLARDEAWFRAERMELDRLESAVRTAEGAWQVHQKNLEAHQNSRPTPDEEPAVAADLETLLVAQRDAGQRRDTARSRLLADDQRRAESAALARELEKRQTAALPWERLNELIGSADGAKFRAIAQRRSLDILVGYANTQLDHLNARYRLERLSESLNLIIIDREMGDERRSVHSLSGGESFLVSLALALALASLTSNRLRIESLFIDEGFGSLDPDTLNTAMSALTRLEAQGRKVGVISHVAEMADAIPVQIQVVKGRAGASRLVVPGAPKADETFLLSP